MNPLYLLVGLFTIIASFFLYQALSYAFRVTVRKRVTGTITGRIHTRSGGGRSGHKNHYSHTVDYESGGEKHTAVISVGNGVFPHYGTGSRVTLLLDEKQPEKAEFFSVQEVLLRIGLCLAGLVFLTIAVGVWLGTHGLLEVTPIPDTVSTG